MKHVGLNVAADPLFTAAYTGVAGALVVVSADDPGMASSQNEQDNRRYAVAAGLPMLEPADSQEAYDFTLLALQVSERWGIPGAPAPYHTRVPFQDCRAPGGRPASVECTSNVCARREGARDDPRLCPARPSPAEGQAGAHSGMERSGGAEPGNRRRPILRYYHFGNFLYARPGGRAGGCGVETGDDLPLPIETIRRFVGSVSRCMVIEEGDPYLLEAIRAAGMQVEGKPEAFRFGELTWIASSAFWRATSRRNPSRRRENRRNCARVALTAQSSLRCVIWIASWPVTSAATRWRCCRPLTPWIRASAWERASAWAGPEARVAARTGPPGGQHHRRQHLHP